MYCDAGSGGFGSDFRMQLRVQEKLDLPDSSKNGCL
jgi:hypothetical protein